MELVPSLVLQLHHLTKATLHRGTATSGPVVCVGHLNCGLTGLDGTVVIRADDTEQRLAQLHDRSRNRILAPLMEIAICHGCFSQLEVQVFERLEHDHTSS